MDAASNRSIDDVRDLRDKIAFAPVDGRFKVYIVDEVHMLTREAFNALLKTLEEPPDNVVFVLATTEPHKIPETIVSRCQRFDFHRPQVTDIVRLLAGIVERENARPDDERGGPPIDIQDEALHIIARHSQGGFRDAIGTLDKLVTYSEGTITPDDVLEALGVTSSDLLFEITDIVTERRTAEALQFVQRLANEGTDYSQFIRDLLRHLRQLFLLQHLEEAAQRRGHAAHARPDRRARRRAVPRAAAARRPGLAARGRALHRDARARPSARSATASTRGCSSSSRWSRSTRPRARPLGGRPRGAPAAPRGRRRPEPARRAGRRRRAARREAARAEARAASGPRGAAAAAGATPAARRRARGGRPQPRRPTAAPPRPGAGAADPPTPALPAPRRRSSPSSASSAPGSSSCSASRPAACAALRLPARRPPDRARGRRAHRRAALRVRAAQRRARATTPRCSPAAVEGVLGRRVTARFELASGAPAAGPGAAPPAAAPQAQAALPDFTDQIRAAQAKLDAELLPDDS